MASLSSTSSQVRLLGSGTSSSSSRNVVFRQRSSLNSNRVSFGLPSRSSSLTLSSSSSISRGTTNGVLSVAAKSSSDTSCYDALERLAIEAGKILVKEVANMFEEARSQLPAGAADDVERLVEEAANALAACETKEKSSYDKHETENHAASGNDTSYVAELQRSAAKAGKILLVKDLTNTFEEITPQKIKENRATDEAESVMAEVAAKTFAERKMKEKRVAERVMAEEAANALAAREIKGKRVADEAEEAAKMFVERKIKEKRYAEEAERVMAEEAAKTCAERKMKEERVVVEEAAKWLAAREIKEKRVADEAEEAAKKLAERKIKEKRVAEEFERVMAEEAAAGKIKEKSSGDTDETDKHATSAVQGWVDAVDEFFGLMKPHLTSLRDSYDVGDCIKIRIGTDVIKGDVISKDYNVTRLETFTEKTPSPMKRIIAVDNHKISWVEILDQSL